MTRTLTTNRTTAPAAIADRATFHNSGKTFHGRPVDTSDRYGVPTARLNSDDAQTLTDGIRNGSVVYVVWSYGTPIGWAYADGRTFVTAQRFSATTSGHQTIARVALPMSPSDPYLSRARAALARSAH